MKGVILLNYKFPLPKKKKKERNERAKSTFERSLTYGFSLCAGKGEVEVLTKLSLTYGLVLWCLDGSTPCPSNMRSPLF